MARSSYYILKNRNHFSILFALIISLSTLYLVALIIDRADITLPTDEIKTISITISVEPQSDRNVFTSETLTIESQSDDNVFTSETLNVEPKIEEVIDQPVVEAKLEPTVVMEEPAKVEDFVELEPVPSEVVEDIPDLSEVSDSKSDISKVVETVEVDTTESDLGYTVKSYDELSSGLNLEQPAYPRSAVKWKKEGVVEVEIEISRDGSVLSAVVVESSGHSILDKACLTTINKKWLFHPQESIVKTRKRFVFTLI